MYFTMDPESKKALFERDGGSMREGEVAAVSGDEIDLLMRWDTPGHVLWSKSRRTITLESFDGKGGKSLKTLQCEETAPRTMIEYHKRLK
jgi:hypothetical protein